MAVRRSPFAIAALTLMAAAGVWIGIRIIFGDAASAAKPLRPDISVQGIAAEALAQHGFRPTGKEPKTWADISLRLVQDDAGALFALRCTIDPTEASALTVFPPGSRRPIDDAPPADWPRAGFGAQAARLALPDWWSPAPGGQARLFAGGGTEASIGIFQHYDPATRVLHIWQWERRGAPPATAVAEDTDDVAVSVETFLRQSARPPTADGWLIADDLAGPGLEAACPMLPPGATVRCALMPWRGRHRYLLVIGGIDEAAAWSLAGANRPLRTLATGTPPAAWGFAEPPGGLPPWFHGASNGAARAHCLLIPGPGTVESGRWAAFDAAARSLVVWDWEDLAAPRPPAADLCAAPVPVRP
jgi:hypothetical protein